MVGDSGDRIFPGCGVVGAQRLRWGRFGSLETGLER